MNVNTKYVGLSKGPDAQDVLVLGLFLSAGPLSSDMQVDHMVLPLIPSDLGSLAALVEFQQCSHPENKVARRVWHTQER
jgi:hypothetical protein